MSKFNITGIKPAYRRLVMDLSITLGQVLDFENARDGGYHVVNVRGQVNSAYAPAQVQDFLDWLLAVSPEWTIHTIPASDLANGIISIEDFNMYQYQSAYTNSTFVKYLARLLHQGSITILMRVVPGGYNTRKLCVEIIERHHVKVLEFISDVVEDITNYPCTDDSLVFMSEDQNVMIEPYQVAAVTQRNNRTMGMPRNLNAVSVLCGALVGRNGTVENAIPLAQAILGLETAILNNLVEYGFKLMAQTCMLKTLHARIMDVILFETQAGHFQPEQNFYIDVDFAFLTDDLKTNPWHVANVTIRSEKLVVENDDQDVEQA